MLASDCEGTFGSLLLDAAAWDATQLSSHLAAAPCKPTQPRCPLRPEALNIGSCSMWHLNPSLVSSFPCTRNPRSRDALSPEALNIASYDTRQRERMADRGGAGLKTGLTQAIKDIKCGAGVFSISYSGAPFSLALLSRC